MDELTLQELHFLAMNIVGKALQEELQWEFLLVNSDMNKNPQFVCVDKDKQKHFIIVRSVPYGQDPDIYNAILMNKMKKHAEEYKAKTYWAGVGLYDLIDNQEPVKKNLPYFVNFKGLLEIN